MTVKIELIHWIPIFFDHLVTLFLRDCKIYCPKMLALHSYKGLGSEIVHSGILLVARWGWNFPLLIAVILLTTYWLKIWDLTPHQVANHPVPQGQLFLNCKCHYSWFGITMWLLRARWRGVEEPEVNASLAVSTWCPDHATYKHRPPQKLGLLFLCQRCHLCLSQCSSDNVNLNASLLLNSHLGDTEPGGFCPTSASSLKCEAILLCFRKRIFPS